MMCANPLCHRQIKGGIAVMTRLIDLVNERWSEVTAAICEITVARSAICLKYL